MDSKTALSFITARYRKALEQLEKEYREKLEANGGMVCLTGGPLFSNEPSALAAYLETRAWRAPKLEYIQEQHAAEIQVWFDCFS